jgi:hypothetical protein
LELFADEPWLTCLSLWYSRDTATGGAIVFGGSFNVFADLRWSTGRGEARAEVDVPAGGAVFTVSGGDGLEVHVNAEGTSTSVVRVRGQISFVRGGHPRAAQRTLSVVLPAGSGTLTRIPAFARAVRCISTVPASLANTRLQFLDAIAGRAEVVCDEDSLPLPGLSQDFAIVDAVNAHTVSTLWELAF